MIEGSGMCDSPHGIIKVLEKQYRLYVRPIVEMNAFLLEKLDSFIFFLLFLVACNGDLLNSAFLQSFSIESLLEGLATKVIKQVCGRQGDGEENYQQLMVR